MIPAALCILEAWRHINFTHPDFLIARDAAHTLLGHEGLQVYSLHPEAQMGPLALIAALLPKPLYFVLISAMLAIPLSAMTLCIEGAKTRWATLGVGLLCVVPWAQLAWKGHADDAVSLSAGAVAVALSLRRRPRAAAIAVAIALTGKPTAVVFLPVVLGAGLEAWLTGAVVVLATWGPFLAADPSGVLHAGRGIMPVGQGCLADLLGYPVGYRTPLWVRPVQLLGGLAAAGWGILRRHPWEGLVIAFALRAIVETNPAPAYSIPLVLFAVAVDLTRRIPLLTPLAFASWWVSQRVLEGWAGQSRLAVIAILVAVTVIPLVRAANPHETVDVTTGDPRPAPERDRLLDPR